MKKNFALFFVSCFMCSRRRSSFRICPPSCSKRRVRTVARRRAQSDCARALRAHRACEDFGGGGLQGLRDEQFLFGGFARADCRRLGEQSREVANRQGRAGFSGLYCEQRVDGGSADLFCQRRSGAYAVIEAARVAGAIHSLFILRKGPCPTWTRRRRPSTFF